MGNHSSPRHRRHTLIHRGATEMLKVGGERSSRIKTLGCVISSHNPIVPTVFFLYCFFQTELMRFSVTHSSINL